MSYNRATLPLTSMVPDLIPQDAPADAWNTAINVVFRNSESVAASADGQVFPFATIDPKTMVYVEPFNTGYWVYADETGVFVTDGTNEFDITPDTWSGFTADTIWTSCVINGLAVVNHSTGDPVWWDGQTGNKCQPLPGWPAGGRCLCMRAHKNFLFAIGRVDVDGSRVAWSDAAEAGVIPGEWTPSNTNLAGFVDLAPLYTDCLEGATLRDEFLVYKRQSVWAFTFVGGNDVFAARMVFHERGIAGTNALTLGPDDAHLLIGSDGDVYVSDGVQMQSVLDGRAQRTFYLDYAGATQSLFSAVTLMREKLSFVIYPQAGEENGTRAIVLDWESQDISFRDMNNVLCAAEGRALADVGTANEWDSQVETWDAHPRAWNTQISARTVQDVMLGTVGQIEQLAAADTTLPVNLEKYGLSFGNPEKRKQVARIWPKIRGRSGDVVQIRVGGQEASEGPIALGPSQEYVIGSAESIDTFWQGRFLALVVQSENTASWRFGTVDVEFREVGGW